jgi:hypothetical protein
VLWTKARVAVPAKPSETDDEPCWPEQSRSGWRVRHGLRGCIVAPLRRALDKPQQCCLVASEPELDPDRQQAGIHRDPPVSTEGPLWTKSGYVPAPHEPVQTSKRWKVMTKGTKAPRIAMTRTHGMSASCAIT